MGRSKRSRRDRVVENREMENRSLKCRWKDEEEKERGVIDDKSIGNPPLTLPKGIIGEGGGGESGDIGIT